MTRVLQSAAYAAGLAVTGLGVWSATRSFWYGFSAFSGLYAALSAVRRHRH